jgi:hypothetical protein
VVRIGLESRGSEAELTVTDNGQGPQHMLCSPGVGMTIIRQLSGRIGATIKIDSCASGTVARLRFPVGSAVIDASKFSRHQSSLRKFPCAIQDFGTPTIEAAPYTSSPTWSPPLAAATLHNRAVHAFLCRGNGLQNLRLRGGR